MTRTYTYTLRKAQEERERRRRDAEYQGSVLKSYFKEHLALQQASKAEERADAEAFQRKAAQRAYEQHLFDSLEKAENLQVAASLAASAADEAAIGQEASAIAQEREAKRRQHIIKGSAELTELQQLISAAKVRVQRDQQLAQRAARDSHEHQNACALDAFQQIQRAAAAKQEEIHEVQRREKGKAALQGLKLQLAFKELSADEAKEQALLERARLDAAAAREDAEDAQVVKARQAKQQQEKLFIKEYLAQQHESKFNKALDLAAEEARIEAFEAQQRAREDAVAALQAQKKARAEMQYESIKGKREAEMHAREEEERLINLLQADELEEASRREAARRQLQAEELRQQMAEANRLQIEIKAARDIAEKEDEEKLRRQLMARFAEEDRLEQASAQRRRMLTEQHKREAARLIAEKQALRAAAKAKEAEAAAAEKAKQLELEAIIAEERERMLAEAEALHLQVYMPHAALSNKPKLPPLTPAYLD